MSCVCLEKSVFKVWVLNMTDPKMFCCCWKLLGGGKFIGWFSIAISILFGFIFTCAIATITNKAFEEQTKEDQGIKKC